MAVLFVASKDNPYRTGVDELASSLGYSQVYPPVEPSELERVLPVLDEKVDLVFIEATGESEPKLVQRPPVIGGERRVFDLQNAPSSLPTSSDISRPILEQALTDAIAYGLMNDAVRLSFDWEAWRKKVEQHIGVKIGSQEFKSSETTPLAAARKANITLGPLKQIPELLKLRREAKDTRAQGEIEEQVHKQLESWSEKPIDPYVEINFLNAHEGELEKFPLYSGWLYDYYATAIVNGSHIDDIKGIMRLSLVARRRGPVFLEVELNPSIRRWADTLIWHGLIPIGMLIIKEIIDNNPEDPLVDWFVDTAIELGNTISLLLLVGELIESRHDAASRLLRILPPEEVKQWFRHSKETIAGHRWLAEAHPDIFELSLTTRPGYSKRMWRVVVK